MLSDPAPGLLVNDASSPSSATGRSTAPQHTAKIIGCSLARLPDQRARHTGGVLPVVTGFRERLPVGEEVLTFFFVPGVPRVFVPCRGTIDQVAAQARPQGKVKGTARRSMAAALRAVMLMALMPEAGYGEILAALFGDLPLVPWHVPFAVPTETVLATWRDAIGPEPVLHLQDMVLGVSAAEHEEHEERAISIGDLHLEG